MSIKDRAGVIARAKQAMAHLETNPATSRETLGNAREILNRIYSWTDPAAIRDAVEGIEALVVEVYGGHPEQESQR